MGIVMEAAKDLSKIAIGVVAVIAIPVGLALNGVRVAWKDNPDDVKGVSDNTEYNWEQFKEGASLGFYDAKKPVPSGKTTQELGAEAADAVSNAAEKGVEVGKKAAEETGNFFDGFVGKLKEKYGDSATPPPSAPAVPDATVTPAPAAPSAATPAAPPPPAATAPNANQPFVCDEACWERIRKQAPIPIPE